MKNKFFIRFCGRRNNNKNEKLRNWYFFFGAIVNIIDTLVPLLTLGFFWSDLRYKYVKWDLFRERKT